MPSELKKPETTLSDVFSLKDKQDLLGASNEDKYGIENLKKIEQFKANLIKEVWSVVDLWKNKGRKPSFFVIFRFFDDVFDFAHIMKKREEIGKEFQDLSKDEVLELSEVFKAALKLENVNLEEFMERTNLVIGINAEYISYLATLKK